MTRNAADTTLIVGAGPTGLTAALELARCGGAVRIIDGKDGPTPLSKAVGISPRSLEILEPSGVTDRLLAEAIRIRQVGVWFEHHRLGTIDVSTLPHRFDFLLSLPQSETESIMADALARFGVTVEWNTRLADIELSDGVANVTLEQPTGSARVRYARVFAADGVDSTVRDRLALAFDGRTHQRMWSIADAQIRCWPHEPGAAHLFLHDSGNIGFIIPIAHNRYRAVSNTADALRCIPDLPDHVRRLRADAFHIPARQMATYQRGGVFFGGDAAHAHSPVGARGMNLGIEDADAFVRRWFADTLDGYTNERAPVARRWIEFSERVLGVAQWTGAAPVSMRNLAIRVVGHVPLLQRPMLERVAGMRE